MLVIAALCIGVGLVAAAGLGAAFVDRPIVYVTRDPATVFDGEWYVGFLSTMGVLVIWTAAIIAGLCGAVLRRARDTRAGLLLAGAVLSGAVALDDALLIHEAALPGVLGIPEDVAVVVYPIALVALLLRYRKSIAQYDWRLLASGVCLLSVSAVVDVAASERVRNDAIFLFEDGTKVVGYALWASFFASVALSSLAPARVP